MNYEQSIFCLSCDYWRMFFNASNNQKFHCLKYGSLGQFANAKVEEASICEEALQSSFTGHKMENKLRGRGREKECLVEEILILHIWAGTRMRERIGIISPLTSPFLLQFKCRNQSMSQTKCVDSYYCHPICTADPLAQWYCDYIGYGLDKRLSLSIKIAICCTCFWGV